MSNVKVFKIEGTMTLNLVHPEKSFNDYSETRDRLLKKLGMINMPGLHDSITLDYGSYNRQMGQYDFELMGEEALSSTFFEQFVEDVILLGGTIDEESLVVRDFEAPQDLKWFVVQAINRAKAQIAEEVVPA